MTNDLKGREFEIAERIAEWLDPLTSMQQKQVMALLRSNGKEFEIAGQAAELLGTLPTDQQGQLMAFLNKRYDPWQSKTKMVPKTGYQPKQRKHR